MIARRAWAALLMLPMAAKVLAATTNELTEVAGEGRNLARRLCELRPTENFTNPSTLSIRPAKGRKREFLLLTITTLTATNWLTVYETQPNTNAPEGQRLTVTHAGTKPNQYTLTHGPTNTPGGGGGLPEHASPMSAFADSDFSLADLGLEFLHWPGQNLLKKELRSGRSCYVLESLNPLPVAPGYARVVSWIDIDSVEQSDQPGLIHAKAYDAHDKLLKEFEWKEVEKVNGRWQVSEVQMRNVQTGSRTTLKFNFGKPE
jgi:hypothetical protein